MPTVLYRVTLTQDERMLLQQISTRGKHGSQKVFNALILLGCNEGDFQEHKQAAARLVEILPISMKKVDRGSQGMASTEKYSVRQDRLAIYYTDKCWIKLKRLYPTLVE